MLCIELKNNNPFFCLAAEEYLLKNFSENIFMLWQSNDTVVVGKHQNAMAEINYSFVHKNNITVARRISGGGTVFHDSGNINFAIIQNVESPTEISFNRFTQPIRDALAILDITALSSRRSDLTVNGKKISGNAQHIYKNRVLHHGTLLFDSNLETLGQSLKIIPGKYHGKAVQSVRSVVTNILPLLKSYRSIQDFSSFLINFQLKNSNSKTYTLSDSDNAAIYKLTDEKFSTPEWNFGYSPKYTFKNEQLISGKKLNIELNVVKGIITGSAVSGDYFSENDTSELNNSLIGEMHIYRQVRQNLESFLSDVPDELVYAFF